MAYAAQTKIKRFRPMLVRRSLADRTDLKVFDQGFGLGHMLFSFNPGCEIAGLELSPTAVASAQQEAQRRGFTKVDLRVFAPGEPYPKEWHGRFDVVLSSHVLEHIEQPAPVVKALVELLGPGGQACLVVPVNERPGEDRNHFHLFTPDSFRRLLEDSGLVIEEMHTVDRLWRVLCPVAYWQERSPGLLSRMCSVGVNALFGPMPHFMLRFIDRVLAVFGVPPRQCFAWCRRRDGAGS